MPAQPSPLAPEEYQILVEQAPILIWRAGTDALCDYFNARWLDFTGRSLEQELGNGWAEGVHPDDMQRCLKTYLDAFGRHETFEMVYRLRRADGAYRWLHDRGVPRFNPGGAFAGYTGSCIDVTERVEAEQKQLRVLQGLLPICLTCKKIRNDEGYWTSVETYIRDHTEAEFSHGFCPDCATRYAEEQRKEIRKALRKPAGKRSAGGT